MRHLIGIVFRQRFFQLLEIVHKRPLEFLQDPLDNIDAAKAPTEKIVKIQRRIRRSYLRTNRIHNSAPRFISSAEDINSDGPAPRLARTREGSSCASTNPRSRKRICQSSDP